MQNPPIKDDENKRNEAINSLKILDTPPEKRFDLITWVASKLFEVPMSTFSIITDQRSWFKSKYGIEKTEVDRTVSICAHALYEKGGMVVKDTTQDDRFKDNPSVVGDPHIRFYAGVPIYNITEQAVGVFCIRDTKPRDFSDEDLELLRALALWCQDTLNQYDLGNSLKAKEEMFAHLENQPKGFFGTILDSSHDAIFSKTLEGIVTSWNRGAERLYGYTEQEMVGQSIEKIVPTDLNDHKMILDVIKQGKEVEHYETIRVKKNGSKVQVLLSASPMYGEHKQVVGAAIVARDITLLKEDKKKLEQHAKELELFNKILIDREAKMMELKKEIENLKERKSNP